MQSLKDEHRHLDRKLNELAEQIKTTTNDIEQVKLENEQSLKEQQNVNKNKEQILY